MNNNKLLKKQYRKYIIPSIASQVVYTTYTMVDGIFVARGVSETALAGVNIAMPYVTVLWALSIMFASGTSAVASRLMGEGRLEEARRVFSRNMTAMVIIGAVISVVTMLGMEALCTFLGATTATREFVKTYLSAIAPFAIVFIASYTLEILTATDGYPSKATAIVSTGVVANTIMDYLFIFVWHKGVWGAAIATSLTQVMVVVIYMIHFLGSEAHIRFCRFDSMKGIFRELSKGLPSGLNELSPGIITFIYVHEIQKYLSEDKLVTYSAVQYMVVILLIMGIGIAQGTQPLLSYYNGAGDDRSVRQLVRYQLQTTTWLQALVVLAVFIFAGPLICVFISSDTTLIEYSVTALKISSVSGLLVGYNMIFTSYFTAMEKPIQGSVISVSRSTVFMLAGILIAVTVFGNDAIWWGMTFDELFTLITGSALIATDIKRRNIVTLNER